MKISKLLSVVFIVFTLASCTGHGYLVSDKYTPLDVTAQLERLSSNSVAERTDAAYRLGELGSRAVNAVPYLINIIEDEDDVLLKTTAIMALGKIGDRRAVAPLTVALKDKNLQSFAKWALNKIDPEREKRNDVDYYIGKLTATDIERREAVYNLEKMGKEAGEATPRLIQILKFENDPAIQSLAISALVKIGDKSVVPQLNDALYNEALFPYAAAALAKIGDQSSVEHLVNFIGDKKTKSYAVSALNSIDPEWEMKILIREQIKRLSSEDPKEREDAAKMFGEKGVSTDENISALMKTLSDKDKGVRKAAADTLTKFNWTPSDQLETIDFLIAKQEWDGLVSIGEPALNKLKSIPSDTEIGDKITKTVNEISEDMRIKREKEKERRKLEEAKRKEEEAKQKLERVEKTPETIVEKPLLQAEKGGLIDTDKQIDLTQSERKTTKQASPELTSSTNDKNIVFVAKINEEQSSPSYNRTDNLITELKNSTRDKKRDAAKKLIKIGAPSVEPLIAVLNDADPNARQYAAWALGDIKDSRAVEPLVKALNDESSAVRWTAAEALGVIGDERAIEPLKKLAESEKDENVKKAIIRVLEKFNEGK